MTKKEGDQSYKYLLVIIGSIIGLLIIILQLVPWFVVPVQQPLSASVKFNSYEQSIQLDAFLDNVVDKARVGSNASHPYKSISGVFSLEIKNSDSKKLTGVEISVPRSLFLQMARKGEEPKRVPKLSAVDRQIFYSHYLDYIEIGEIEPQESVSITCWASHSPDDPRYSKFELVHDQGEGVINFLTPTFSKESRIRVNWVWIFLCVLSFAPLTIVIFYKVLPPLFGYKLINTARVSDEA